MRKVIILLLTAGVVSVGCGSNEEATTNATETTSESQPLAPPQSNLGEAGTSKLMSVVADYYALKDAFVASDQAKTSETGEKLATSATELQEQLKNDSTANAAALMPYLDTLKMSKNYMFALKGSDIEEQRISFEQISNSMYSLLKAVNLQNGKVYRQYCPMAFNDKGAYWLSDVTDIKNPYFGKKMLECGEVTDSL